MPNFFMENCLTQDTPFQKAHCVICVSYMCHTHKNSADFRETIKQRKPLKIQCFQGFLCY